MKTCAIICSGLSLREYDLGKIKVPIIGLNWGFKMVDANIHIWTGATLIKMEGANFAKLTPKAEKRFCSLPINDAFTPKITDKVNGINDAKHYEIPLNYDIYKDGWVLAGGASCALQIAVSLGFNDITFLGLDLVKSVDFHCFSNESKTGIIVDELSGHSREQAVKAWELQTKYLKSVWQGLKARGIKVTNLGISRVFPTGDFREIT
jgi:hypothetical protein